MKVLILGAAGYVGTIIRPAFEAEHEVFYSDMAPVPGTNRPTVVCDIEETDKLAPAFGGMDCVIYLPYGRKGFRESDSVDLGFNVNVRAVYKCAKLAIDHNVANFTYASSLSVFKDLWDSPPLTEARTPDAKGAYGITKWLGEQVCQILSYNSRQSTFLMLRLILPRQEHEWTEKEKFDPNRDNNICATGPNDTRRLFLAAASLRRPGYHMVHASGDLLGKTMPNGPVTQLLGWMPRNE